MIADCVVLAELCDFDPFEKSYLRIQVVVQGLTHYLVTETSTEYKYTYKRQIKEIPELEIDSCVFCVNEYFTEANSVYTYGEYLEEMTDDFKVIPNNTLKLQDFSEFVSYIEERVDSMHAQV